MAIHLDHLLVPARDRRAAAELLAGLLDVPWTPDGAVGPFSEVFVSDGLTIDFDEQPDGGFPLQHYCFRFDDDAALDALLARLQARGIPYRSTPMGPVDMKVNTAHGGRLFYWSLPDGHAWEALTVSYARQVRDSASPTT